MHLLTDPARRLSLLLWLIALHSTAVGIGLIWHPPALLAKMGYAPCSEPFFPTQGGVFHVVMAVCYGMAAWNPRRNRALVTFTITVKLIATLFLILYWAFAARLPMILFSGLGDGAMAAAVVWAYATWRSNDIKGDP